MPRGENNKRKKAVARKRNIETLDIERERIHAATKPYQSKLLEDYAAHINSLHHKLSGDKVSEKLATIYDTKIKTIVDEMEHRLGITLIYSTAGNRNSYYFEKLSANDTFSSEIEAEDKKSPQAGRRLGN